MVDADTSAMSLFRLRHVPTLAQIQASGRIPMANSQAQTDCRECIEDFTGRGIGGGLRRREAVSALEAKVEGLCFAAFEAVVAQLQASNAPSRDRGGRSGQAAAQAGIAFEDEIPFYVRWETPRYSPSEVAQMDELHAKALATAQREDDDSSVVPEPEAPDSARVLEESRARLLRWPLNPTPWLDPDPGGGWEEPPEEVLRRAEHRARREQQAALEAQGIAGATGDAAFGGDGGGRTVSKEGMVMERVKLDPLYESLVKRLERESKGDVLKLDYFPTTKGIVRYRQVHPMDLLDDGPGLSESLVTEEKGEKEKENKKGAGAKKGPWALLVKCAQKGPSQAELRVEPQAEQAARPEGEGEVQGEGSEGGKAGSPPLRSAVKEDDPRARSTAQVTFSEAPLGAVSQADDRAAREAAIEKIMDFLKKDRKNAQALSMIFVKHDRMEKVQAVGRHKAERMKARKEGRPPPPAPQGKPGESPGLPIAKIMTEFKTLGVGLSSDEAAACYRQFDTDGDGLLSGTEFMEVLKVAQEEIRDRIRKQDELFKQGKAPEQAAGGAGAAGAAEEAPLLLGAADSHEGGDAHEDERIEAHEEGGETRALVSQERTVRWSAEAVGADEAPASPGASSGGASAPQSLGQRTGTAGVSSPSGGVRPGSGWRRELVDLFGNEGNYEHERGVFDYSEIASRTLSLLEEEEAEDLLDPYAEVAADDLEEDDVDLDDSELDALSLEKMTDASYELRGLAGTMLPASVSSHVAEVSLKAASNDPNFLPLSCADLCGAPPNSAAAQLADPISLLVTASMFRQRARSVRSLAKEKTRRLKQRFEAEAKRKEKLEGDRKRCKAWFKNLRWCGKGNAAKKPSHDPAAAAEPAEAREAREAAALAEAEAEVPPLPVEAAAVRGGARVSVLLLGALEPTDSPVDFDPAVHGLLGFFRHPTWGHEVRGVLLPPLPERALRETRAPAPPYWLQGDPTAIEGYASNRRHTLKRLLAQCGYLGPITDELVRGMTVIRFQILAHGSMNLAEYRALVRRRDEDPAAKEKRERRREAKKTRGRKCGHPAGAGAGPSEGFRDAKTAPEEPGRDDASGKFPAPLYPQAGSGNDLVRDFTQSEAPLVPRDELSEAPPQERAKAREAISAPGRTRQPPVIPNRP